MRTGVMNKLKYFIIATLIILVAGMTLFGIFGLNQTVDYKNGYEMQVSIDQDAVNSVAHVKEATNAYFAEKGINAVNSVYQEMNDGKILVYKFSWDVTEAVSGLEAHLRSVLDSKDLKVVGVDVSVYSVKDNVGFDNWWALVAMGVALVAIFLYVIIMEKLAASVATVCSTVLSALMFIALMGLTRLPANPFFPIAFAMAVIIGAGLSATTVRRYREEAKNVASEKLGFGEIVDKATRAENRKYCLVLAIILVATIALIAVVVPYLMFAGAQLLVAGVAGALSSYVMSPLLWTAVKSKRKK